MSPPRISPSKYPPKTQELKNPLLQRNRTESQASYEGNTIDMVRIVRKNQQSRHSLVNIDRREYLNNQPLNHHQLRHSETHRNTHDQPENFNNYEEPYLSSTFVHQGTEFFQHQPPEFIEHYIRPSNVNLLNSINQEGNNKVLGLTLFCVFLVLFSLETLVSGYFLYGCHVIISHFDYVLVLNYELYDEVFEQIERGNFFPVLMLYLGVQCVYHGTILAINSYTKGKYKLIDKQTSRLSYILKSRDFNRNSHSHLQKLIRSPTFTISLILLSTCLSCYSLIHCYYYNELNFVFVYFMSSPIISLIEIFYFSVLLPDIWRYLFFQKMHGEHEVVESQDQERESEQWRLPPFTHFMIEKWWIKLALLILALSVIYAVLIDFWLIVLSFAKLQISFKKMKYKIDTFYLEFVGKLILLVLTLILIYIREDSFIFLTFNYSLECLALIPLAFLLTRVLAHFFLRQQLYKYLYSEMNINLGNSFFAFSMVYAIRKWVGQVDFLTLDVIVVGILCFGLGISLYAEENNRMVIHLVRQEEKSQGLELRNF